MKLYKTLLLDTFCKQFLPKPSFTSKTVQSASKTLQIDSFQTTPPDRRVEAANTLFVRPDDSIWKRLRDNLAVNIAV